MTITVSVVNRRPVPKAIAFGGVATGSMKLSEQAIVAGSVRYNGWTQIRSASLFNSGTNKAQEAEFEVISVNRAAIVEHKRQIVHGSHPVTTVARPSATQSEKPDASDASAMA